MTNEVAANPAEADTIDFEPLGEVFSEARNAKNLTIKDVSNNLRLSIKQIEALESNNFSNLPSSVITRGFIRNYARFLELDAEPLLASYRIRMPDASPSTLAVKTSMSQVMPGKETSSLLKYILLSGLVLLAITSWFYYINYIQKPTQQVIESVANTTVKAISSEATTLPEVALPAAERLTQTDAAEASVNVPAEIVGDVKETPDQATLSTTVALAKVEQARSLSASNSTATVQNLELPKETIDFNALKESTAKTTQTAASIKASSNEMKASELVKGGLKPSNSTVTAVKDVSIAVTEQTWIRVTDKTGTTVYEKMLQANSEDGFNGLPPLKVLIGNAKATKLTFLGQNVDLSSKTKNNVARLILE